MDNILYQDPEHQAFHFEAGPARALLIHGFTGTPRDMRPLAQELAAAGVTARGVLLPGFAQSTDALRHVRATDWLAAAREAWIETRSGASHATLIGFSMGGAIALALAAESGLAPDQLILLAPHWRFADRRAIFLPLGKHFIRTFRPFGRPNFADPNTRRALAQLAPGADLDDPAVRRQLDDAFTIPTHALNELRRINTIAAASSRRCTAPSLILQGLQDSTTLPVHSRTLAARIGAQLLELPGDHIIVDPNRPSWPIIRNTILSQLDGTPNSSPSPIAMGEGVRG
jgi:carboxylesterase